MVIPCSSSRSGEGWKRLKCDSPSVRHKQNTILFFILSAEFCSVYHSISLALENVHPQSVYQKGCPYIQPRLPTPTAPPLTQPPLPKPNQSATLQTPSNFSFHLFFQAVACCFTGTSPCFVLFSPLFVFNWYGGGQLISLPPRSICSPHSCGTMCLLAHLLPSPNATSLQMD